MAACDNATGSGLAAQFDVRSANIEDPLVDNRNIGRTVSRKGLEQIQRAMKRGLQRLTTCLKDAAKLDDDLTRQGDTMVRPQSASGGSAGVSATWPWWEQAQRGIFQFFRRTVRRYGTGSGWRPDLLRHPRQERVWYDIACTQHCFFEHIQRRQEVASSRALTARSPLDVAVALAGVFHPTVYSMLLVGQGRRMHDGMAYASLLLPQNVTVASLVALTVSILDMEGPTTVGEVGKKLQDATKHKVRSSCDRRRGAGPAEGGIVLLSSCPAVARGVVARMGAGAVCTRSRVNALTPSMLRRNCVHIL